jgi:transcriptional regulator with XRE-family HTH domain
MVLNKIELGKLIKKAREYKAETIGEKYTQEMLANDIGIARSSIGDFESGRKYPKYDYLAKIADACGVNLSFFGEEETEKISYDDPNIFNRLPQDLQEFVLHEESKPYLVVAKQLSAYDLEKLTEREMQFLIDWLKMAIEKTRQKE